MPTGRKSAVEDDDLSGEAVQHALNEVFRDALPTLTAVAAGIFAVLAGTNAVLLPDHLATTMSWAAGATAAVLLGLYAWSRLGTIPPRWAHPVGGFVGAMALANAAYPAYHMGAPRLTTDFMLIVVGAGMFLLSYRWHMIVVGATTATWAAFVATAPASPDWPHFTLAMLFAVALSIAVHSVRVRTHRRLEAHRRQEVRHADALHASVRATSRSEDRYRRLAQGAFEAVVIARGHHIDDANDAALRMFGYPDGDVERMDVLDLVAPVSRAAVKAHLAAGDGTPLTVVGRRCGGRIFPVEVRARRLGGSGEDALAVALREVPPDRLNALEEEEEAPDATGAPDAFPDDDMDAEAIVQPPEEPWVRRLMREMKEYVADHEPRGT